MNDHRLALCGAGMISIAHASAAAALGVPVVAVASRDPRHAVERTERTGGMAVLFDELPADADIVAVCTAPAHHARGAAHALSSGAIAVVETPLCTTLAEADHLVAIGGDRLVHAENLLVAPVSAALLDRVPTIGRPTFIEVRLLQQRPVWSERGRRSWGGGVLFDLGSKAIGLVLAIAALGECGRPVSVTADMSLAPGGETDDDATVTITFSTGTTARVHVSWRHPDGSLWDAQVSTARGVLRADLQPVQNLEMNGDPVPLPPTDPTLGGLESGGYVAQMRTVLDVADGRARPIADAEFGRAVLDVVCAACVSARHDGTVEQLPYSGRRDRTPAELWSL